MKNLLTLLLLVLLFGCDDSNRKLQESYNSKVADLPYGLSTIVHDSCEYVVFRYDGGVEMEPKTNCKFHPNGHK